MTKENPTIRLFEKYADQYDEMQRAIVPRYEEIVSTVGDAYRHYIGEGHFLDVGCGTGNVSIDILKGSPWSKAFLQDGSPSMVRIAAEKITKQFGAGALLGNKAVNLEDPAWCEGIARPFDAIVSAFVLEHLQEPDYRSVIARCGELLKKGGILVSVEWSDNAYGMQEWFFAEMAKRGAGHKKYEQIIEEGYREEKHYFVNIETKLGWIRDAGYNNVHTIWQNLFGYVVVGER